MSKEDEMEFEKLEQENEELRTRVAELEKDREKIRQEALDELYIDPCPKCGEGASFGCYACRAKEAESKLSTLLKASEGMEKALADSVIQMGRFSMSASNENTIAQAQASLADFRALKETK